MTRRRDDLLDTLITLAGLALHVAASYQLDVFPPNGGFEAFIVGLPLAVGAVAIIALLVRGERRPLKTACLVEWLLALYTLPASFVGLAFVPSAAVLSIAVFRTRTPISTAPPDAA